MAGIKKRAKSCGTCRIRKKGGCDMKRPACGQCQSRGLICDGYRQETVFVHVTHQKQHERYISNRGDDRQPPTSVAAAANAVSLVKSANEERYLAVFWDAYLPHGRQIPQDVMGYTGGGWTNALPALAPKSPIIRKILLAMCLKTAGHVWNQAREKEEGLKYFASSLSDMSSALARPGCVDPLALSLTSRLYSLHEVLYGHDERDQLAQGRNWQKHIHGELAIIASSPPESYVSGYQHQFFVDGRFHLTTGSVRLRRRCILSDEAWKTTPWREIPKTPKDLLLDIFVEIPTLLEDLDTMLDCPDADRQRTLRHQLIQKCRAHESALTCWRAVVGIADPTYRIDGADVSSPPPTVQILAAAHILCVYWSTCIILYSTLQIASPQDFSELLPLADPRHYCRRIAEGVAILLHPVSGVYGVHLANFPTAVAMMYLNAIDGVHISAEKRMFLDVFQRPGHGTTVNRFVRSTTHHQQQQQSVVGRGSSSPSPAAVVDDEHYPSVVEAQQAKFWFRVERW